MLLRMDRQCWVSDIRHILKLTRKCQELQEGEGGLNWEVEKHLRRRQESVNNFDTVAKESTYVHESPGSSTQKGLEFSPVSGSL